MTLKKAIDIGTTEGRVIPGLLDKNENEEAIMTLLKAATTWNILKETLEEGLEKTTDSLGKEKLSFALELVNVSINSIERKTLTF